ncbi:MAG: hypothetical protein HZC28_08540 [Spirochaetes bacterium]|nr:hypothetical protein [Spirochaetota bacterium]
MKNATLAQLLWKYETGSAEDRNAVEHTLRLLANPIWSFLQNNRLDEIENMELHVQHQKKVRNAILNIAYNGITITHIIEAFNYLMLFDADGNILITYQVQTSWNEEYMSLLDGFTGSTLCENNRLTKPIQF